MVTLKKMILVGVAVMLVAVGYLVVNGALSGQTADASEGQGVWLARNVGTARDTIGFDAAAKGARFILPQGLRSADGAAYWAAFHAGNTTALHSFNVNDGSIAATISLDGMWDLGAVSATGKWLALKRVPSEAETAAWTKTLSWKTDVAVIDTATGKPTRMVALDGNFDVDALNAQGTMLYLIEHLPVSKPDYYQVRAYDVVTGALAEGVIVDKRNIDELMAGYPTEQVASPNGEWLFTVYVRMQEDNAFIHALNLANGYAWCIDLPSGDGNPAMLENYALALAPDGHTIYASNAVLGVLAIADVNAIDEPRVVRFAAAEKFEAKGAPVKSSVVSPDGKQVFMSNGGVVWAFDAVTQKAQEVKRGTMPIVALGWDAHANTLLLAQADHSVFTLAEPKMTQAEAVSAQVKPECPTTQPPATLFVPPAPYPSRAPYGGFWYGKEGLWTNLTPNGAWYDLPYVGSTYPQKIFWWHKGYSPLQEPKPAFRLMGKQLDGSGAFTTDDATNAEHADFGGWTILTGVDIPSQGCWEITGEYKGEKLSFVVRVGE